MNPFLKSFAFAAEGLRWAWKGTNFRVQSVLGLAALTLAILLRLKPTALAVVIFLIGFVLAMETTNSAVEEICNKFHPENHPHIALIKDLAAGAVLISSLAAAAAGVVLFLPYI